MATKRVARFLGHRRTIVMAALGCGAIALTACARPVQPELSAACQLEKCVCAPAVDRDLLVRPTAPIVWQANGDASCPPEFVLRRERQFLVKTVAERRRAFSRQR